MPRPSLLSYIEASLRTIAEGVPQLFYILFIGVITGIATLAVTIIAYRSFVLFVFSLTLYGFVGLLFVENQDRLLESSTNATNTVSSYLNNQVIDQYLNPLLECVGNVLVEIANIIVLTTESIIWRAAQEFGVSIFGHAAYVAPDISLPLGFGLKDTVVPPRETSANQTQSVLGKVDKYMLEQWVSVAQEIEIARLQGNATIPMEMRAQALGHQVYRLFMLPGKQERFDFFSFYDTACNFIGEAFIFIIDTLKVVIEFAFLILDAVVDLAENIAEGKFTFKFIKVLVKVLIKVILEFLDPKGCFDGFPNDFPISFAPCLCPTVYPTRDDAPEDAISMLGGCLCGNAAFNVNGDLINDILRPCLELPFMETILDLIQLFTEVLNDIRKDIERIKSIINGIIQRIRDRINDALDKLKRSDRAIGSDGLLYEIHSYTDGDYEVFTIYNNASGNEMRQIGQHRIRDPAWITAELEKIEEIDRQIALLNQPLEDFTQLYKRHHELHDQIERPKSRGLPPPPREVPTVTDYLKEVRDDNIFKSLVVGQVKEKIANHVDNITARVEWSELSKKSKKVCGEDCEDDFRTMAFFVRDMLHVVSTAMREPSKQMSHRHRLNKMDFSGARSALARTAVRIDNNKHPASSQWHQYARDLTCAAQLHVTAFFRPDKFPEAIRDAPPEIAESTLTWLETNTNIIDKFGRATSENDARMIIAEQVREFHHGMAQKLTRTTLEGRAVPVIAISIVLVGGVSSAALLGLGGALFASLLPLCGFLAILLAIFFFACFGVLASLSSSMVTIFFTGDITAADPFNPFVFLFDNVIGTIFQNGLDSVDFNGFRETITDSGEGAGWYFVLTFVQNFIPTIPYFASAPPLVYDPESGLTLDSLTSYFGKIFACNPFEPCSVSGAYGGAPCRCQVFPGSYARRDATPEDPCPITNDPRYYCIPFFREGVQLSHFGTVDNPKSCKDYNFPNGNFMVGSSSFGELNRTWFKTTNRVLQVIVRHLFGGFKLHFYGVFAAIIFFPFCCLKPFGNRIAYLTFALFFISPILVYYVKPYFIDIQDANRNNYLGEFLEGYTTEEEIDWDLTFCAIRYHFAAAWTIGVTIIFTFPVFLWIWLGGIYWLLQVAMFITIPFQLGVLFIWYFYLSIGPDRPDMGLIFYMASSEMGGVLERRNRKLKLD